MSQVCPILDRATPVGETNFSRDSWSIVRCRETGFVFLENPPDYSQLETEFAWEETYVEEKRRRVEEEPVFSRVSTFAKTTKSTLFPKRNKIASIALGIMQRIEREKSPTVLDIGCGEGNLMVELHSRFSNAGREMVPLGIEVSRQLAINSGAKLEAFGGKVLCSNALDGVAELPDGSVDLALMCSFLEHECQPLRLLQRLHRVLGPGGSVVVKVPNFDCWNRVIRGRKWCGFRFPDHVNYFTPQTLQMLAQEAGFTISRQSMRDKFPLSDNMYAVLVKTA